MSVCEHAQGKPVLPSRCERGGGQNRTEGIVKTWHWFQLQLFRFSGSFLVITQIIYNPDPEKVVYNVQRNGKTHKSVFYFTVQHVQCLETKILRNFYYFMSRSGLIKNFGRQKQTLLMYLYTVREGVLTLCSDSTSQTTELFSSLLQFILNDLWFGEDSSGSEWCSYSLLICLIEL